MSARISSAVACHVACRARVAAHLGELGGPVERHPAHQLRRHVVLRRAPRLPDALVRLRPHLRRARGLGLHERPQPPGQSLAAPRVEQDGVEHGAEHVVLALVERAVADPHRAGAVVAAEVVERRLLQVAAPVDAVHDLHAAVIVGLEIGDELHELVGLPVQVQPVQRLQGERRVAHPAVAVVPVALTAGRLGQSGRQRRHGGARRHVRQTLDRQRRTLDRLPVAVIGDPGPVQPPPPERHRGVEPCLGVARIGRGGEVGGPRQRAVHAVTGLEHVTTPYPAPFDADAQVGVQPHRDVATGRLGDMTRVVDDRPRRRHPSVVEHRLAHQLHLDPSTEALDDPDQRVLGVVIGGRARVRA